MKSKLTKIVIWSVLADKMTVDKMGLGQWDVWKDFISIRNITITLIIAHSILHIYS